MVERRKYKRLDISIPLRIKLLGAASYPLPVDVETANISLEGLSIVIKIKIKEKNRRLSVQGGEDSIKLIPYLLLHDKVLELGIKILPKGGVIKGVGKVMWYDRGLRGEFYYVRAGILIREMERVYREKWLEFLRTVDLPPKVVPIFKLVF